jgi:hypothetical protein
MAVFSTTARDILDKSSLPEFQAQQLGTALYEQGTGQLVAFTRDNTAAFNAAAVPVFTAPFAMQIVNVIVEAHATEGSGTVKVMKAADDICTAIACAADGVVSQMSAGASNATKARRTLAAGDIVNIQAAGGTAANIRGRVTVVGVRL